MARTIINPPAINECLKQLMPYLPGKPIEEVKREFNLDSVIKLASNENPLGPSPRAMKAMAAVAGEMNLYPDGAGFYLKNALAERLGVADEELVLGNGSDEITALLAQVYLNPQNELITSNYAFVRYSMVADMMGAKKKFVPMNDMRHDLKAIAKAIGDQTAMVCLDIPCNPTGTTVTARELTTFLKRIPPRVIVVLDQGVLRIRRRRPGLSRRAQTA